MVNVLLVENSRLAQDVIQRHLAQSRRYHLRTVIEQAGHAQLTCRNGTYDLVLMDICTAAGDSGLAAAAALKQHLPTLRVVLMTAVPEHSFLAKAKATGCDGFWYKEYGQTDLLDVLDHAMGGQPLFPDQTPSVPVGITQSSKLTQRELEVVRLLVQGCRYDEIAAALGISPNTVKYHIKNLLSKTGHRNTIQLVVDVVSKKLILPPF